MQRDSYATKEYSNSLLLNAKPEEKLGKIIEIVTNEEDFSSSSFFQRSMFHIPFIAQELDREYFSKEIERDAITKIIIAKVTRIKRLYQDITGKHETVRIINDKTKTSIRDVSEQVYRVINQ